MAIRLGRAFTGRKRILPFAENFHAAGENVILSSTHTEEDVDKTVAALAGSLESMISEGSL